MRVRGAPRCPSNAALRWWLQCRPRGRTARRLARIVAQLLPPGVRAARCMARGRLRRLCTGRCAVTGGDVVGDEVYLQARHFVHGWAYPCVSVSVCVRARVHCTNESADMLGLRLSSYERRHVHHAPPRQRRIGAGATGIDCDGDGLRSPSADVAAAPAQCRCSCGAASTPRAGAGAPAAACGPCGNLGRDRHRPGATALRGVRGSRRAWPAYRCMHTHARMHARTHTLAPAHAQGSGHVGRALPQ